MNPYNLNPVAISEFMKYHDISDQSEVAKLFGFSPAYLSLLLKGKRRLNEFLRLRIQLVTRLPQDKLFIPDTQANPFNQQSFAYMKHFGVMPYDKYSTEFNAYEERYEQEALNKKSANEHLICNGKVSNGHSGNGNSWAKKKRKSNWWQVKRGAKL